MRISIKTSAMTRRSYAERERERKQKRLKETGADNAFCSPVVGNKRKAFCILWYINKTRKTRSKTSECLPFNTNGHNWDDPEFRPGILRFIWKQIIKAVGKSIDKAKFFQLAERIAQDLDYNLAHPYKKADESQGQPELEKTR